MPLSPTMRRNSSFMNRTFSPLGKGSVRGSIFNLSASAIGSGVLTLPYVLALNGWAAGIVLITVAACAAKLSLTMLAAKACEHNLPNYSKVVIKAGGKWLSYLLKFGIIGYMYIASVGYQVIVT